MADKVENSLGKSNNKENSLCDIEIKNGISESGNNSTSETNSGIVNTISAEMLDVVDKYNMPNLKQAIIDDDCAAEKPEGAKGTHFKANDLYSVAEMDIESDSKPMETEYITDGNCDMESILGGMGSEPVGVLEAKSDGNVIDATKAIKWDATSMCTHRRIPHMHKLEKKHSSGDLHSRLKTRKLLGVGETDDGDVHRSKLSQILGHSDQLYIRLPGGLRIWQIILSIIFTVLSIWTLLFPVNFIKSVYDMDGSTFTFAIHLYACSLTCIAVMYWSTVHAADRDVIRMVLLSSVVFCTLHTCVLLSCWLSWLPSSIPGTFTVVMVMIAQIVVIVISLYFYWITIKDCKTKDARYFR